MHVVQQRTHTRRGGMLVGGTRIAILALATLACTGPQTSKGKYMTDAKIEQMIAEGDWTVVSRESLDSVEKRPYPFVPRYLHSKNPDVRNIAVIFLSNLEIPWCAEPLLTATRDEIVGNRAIAAAALIKVAQPANTDRLFEEIEWQNATFPDEEDQIVHYFALAVGKVGSEKDIDRLLSLRNAATSTKAREACDKALTRLGHSQSVEELRELLATGSAEERRKALDIVSYTESGDWTEDVKPLLLDERIAVTYPIGPKTITKRVCDMAAVVLSRIAPIEGLEVTPVVHQSNLPQGVIDRAREAYGVELPPNGASQAP